MNRDDLILAIYGLVPDDTAGRNGAVAYLFSPYGQEQVRRAGIAARGRYWESIVGDRPAAEWVDAIDDPDAAEWILAERVIRAL